jgi:hypothetical protein
MSDAVVYLRFIGCPVLEGSRTWQPHYKAFIQNCYMARLMTECEPPAGMCVPPPPETKICDLDFTDKAQENIYNAIYKNIEGQFRDAQKLKGAAYNLSILQVLLRLRQVSVAPQLYISARKKEDFGWSGPDFLPSRKFEEIATLLRTARDNGESRRWIIFCQFF